MQGGGGGRRERGRESGRGRMKVGEGEGGGSEGREVEREGWRDSPFQNVVQPHAHRHTHSTVHDTCMLCYFSAHCTAWDTTVSDVYCVV